MSDDGAECEPVRTTKGNRKGTDEETEPVLDLAAVRVVRRWIRGRRHGQGRQWARQWAPPARAGHSRRRRGGLPPLVWSGKRRYPPPGPSQSEQAHGEAWQQQEQQEGKDQETGRR